MLCDHHNNAKDAPAAENVQHLLAVASLALLDANLQEHMLHV